MAKIIQLKKMTDYIYNFKNFKFYNYIIIKNILL